MAARTVRIEQTQKTRDKIRTGLLIYRLQKQAFDEVEMSSNAIAAAKILIAKTLPDLKAVEHSGGVAVQVTGIDLRVIR